MSVYELIGRALKIKLAGPPVRYDHLVADIDAGREVDPEAAALLLREVGADETALMFDVADRQRARELQGIIDQKDARKAAVDAAGVVKAETTQRHFAERREMERRQRDERNGAAAELESARHAVEEVEQAERELRDIRRCATHGPVTERKWAEIREASVMAAQIVTVHRDLGRLEYRSDEDGTIRGMSLSQVRVPLSALQPGVTVGVESVGNRVDGFQLAITRVISQPAPMFARPAKAADVADPADVAEPVEIIDAAVV